MYQFKIKEECSLIIALFGEKEEGSGCDGDIDPIKVKIVKELRKLKDEYPEMDIIPVIGFSDVIKIICEDPESSNWDEIKRKVREIIRNTKKEVKDEDRYG